MSAYKYARGRLFQEQALKAAVNHLHLPKHVRLRTCAKPAPNLPSICSVRYHKLDPAYTAIVTIVTIAKKTYIKESKFRGHMVQWTLSTILQYDSIKLHRETFSQTDCSADQPVAGPSQPTTNPKAQT
eukprot:1157357-Pelagomonas_calceolata.AAC.1